MSKRILSDFTLDELAKYLSMPAEQVKKLRPPDYAENGVWYWRPEAAQEILLMRMGAINQAYGMNHNEPQAEDSRVYGIEAMAAGLRLTLAEFQIELDCGEIPPPDMGARWSSRVLSRELRRRFPEQFDDAGFHLETVARMRQAEGGA